MRKRVGRARRRLARALARRSHFMCIGCIHGEHDWCDRTCEWCGFPCRCRCRRSWTRTIDFEALISAQRSQRRKLEARRADQAETTAAQ